MRQSGRKYSGGFTLIELMVTVGVIAIVLSMAIPSFTLMIKDTRLVSSGNEFIGDLQTARSEAVSEVKPVTICKQNAAATDCNAAGGWQQGWIIFIDLNANQVVDAGETILSNHPRLSPIITLVGSGGSANAITYRPSGVTTLTTLETLILCDDRGFGASSKGIVVSVLGRGSMLKASETTKIDCNAN